MLADPCRHQCYRQMAADTNWAPYLDSLYENLETGEITACDISIQTPP